MSRQITILLCLLCSPAVALASPFTGKTWECRIYPKESREMTDPQTGTRLLFVTTRESNDFNLYFHQRSWLPDESILLFNSDREGRPELFGYVEKTGEIVRLSSPGDSQTHGWTAAKSTNSLYLLSRHAVYEWEIRLSSAEQGEQRRTRVSVSERKICDLPAGVSPVSDLNENSDGTCLSLAYRYANSERWEIVLIDKSSGAIRRVACVDWPVLHLQCSWVRPDLVMFARGGYSEGDRAPAAEQTSGAAPQARIWFADLSSRLPWPLHYQHPGELVTHECWWTGDLLTFCGGYLPGESHVKVADINTGTIRIIGAGSWWPGASPAELAKRNWWHAAGAPTGEWVAADNWHGDIALFDARTTQMRLLTTGHRTYGGGAHPHVGWAPSGRRVVFTSNMLGQPDVSIATIPQDWCNKQKKTEQIENR